MREWAIRLHQEQPKEPLIGDMWPVTRYLQSQWIAENYLSNEYFAIWARIRPPLMVMLPGSITFCIDSKAGCDHTGWQIMGMPPKITISPSINILGGFHGFIHEGMVLG